MWWIQIVISDGNFDPGLWGDNLGTEKATNSTSSDLGWLPFTWINQMKTSNYSAVRSGEWSPWRLMNMWKELPALCPVPMPWFSKRMICEKSCLQLYLLAKAAVVRACRNANTGRIVFGGSSLVSVRSGCLLLIRPSTGLWEGSLQPAPGATTFTHTNEQWWWRQIYTS